jgi:hypothetical protein
MNSKIRNFLSLFLRIGAALGIIVTLIALKGCASTCAIITNLDAQPQWVCPGKDFSPKVDFGISNFNEDGNLSGAGHMLWTLWETTNAKPYQPGAVNLNNNVGQLSNPYAGFWETPGGVHVVSGAQAAGYQFSLIAANDECPHDAGEYMKSHQKEIENMFGVELDDNEIMTALAKVELISAVGNRKLLCISHVYDIQGGFTWVKSDEARAGDGIVIDGIENSYPFSLEIEHMLPSGSVYAVLKPKGDPQAKTTVFDGRTPNGKWSAKAVNSADYDKYIKHNLKWVGKPSICLTIGIKCQ